MNFWSEKIAFSVLSSTAANSFEGQKCVCEDNFDDSCACRQEEKIRIKRQGELSHYIHGQAGGRMGGKNFHKENFQEIFRGVENFSFPLFSEF